MNAAPRSKLALLKQFRLGAIVAALIVGASPAATAQMPTRRPVPPPKAEPEPMLALTPERAVAPTPARRLSPTSAPPRLVTRSIKEKSTDHNYKIDVAYPVVTDPPADVWQPFNIISEGRAYEIIAEFKNPCCVDPDLADFADGAEEAFPEGAEGADDRANDPSYLLAEWKVFHATPDFISVRVEYTRYETGAAHPNTLARDQLRSAAEAGISSWPTYSA